MRDFLVDLLIGEFGRAEDALYETQDEYPDWPAEAEGFYRRLLKLPDDALIRGGLPREEVVQGLEEAAGGK